MADGQVGADVVNPMAKSYPGATVAGAILRRTAKADPEGRFHASGQAATVRLAAICGQLYRMAAYQQELTAEAFLLINGGGNQLSGPLFRSSSPEDHARPDSHQGIGALLSQEPTAGQESSTGTVKFRAGGIACERVFSQPRLYQLGCFLMLEAHAE
jgi:hypothetical protein